LSGNRSRIAIQPVLEISSHQSAQLASPLETLPSDSPQNVSTAHPRSSETFRHLHEPAECNPPVNLASTSANKRPRLVRGDADDAQKSNQALLLEGNFRVVEHAGGDVDEILAQINLPGCSQIAITVIDRSFSSPFHIFGRATAEFDHLFGFVIGIEIDHRDISDFVALIMPNINCLEFMHKLLCSQLPVCMWNVMEVLRQCEKQTHYRNNIDWSLRNCTCLSAAIWLIDPSADCTDFESCISFIKSFTQLQPPIPPSETISVPSDKHSRYVEGVEVL
jgi:hypothetical protein